MRVAIVGTGYVGLVSGACFADFGHHVTCVDKDGAKIATLNAGTLPIFEPGLEELVATNLRRERLAFTTDLRGAVAAADVVMIAVGTPPRRDGFADLSQVHAAAREIAAALRTDFTVLVTKSTVPVGSSDEMELMVRQLRPDADFVLVANPEFLREGAAIQDFKRPDRIVVGAEDARAQAVMSMLYRPLRRKSAPIFFTERRTAELIKYASNAFLATKITFINELADLCENVGADVQHVAHGVGLDHRIGPKFLRAGPGFGGSCFPKDLLALMKIAQDHAAPMRLVETVVAINDARKRLMARKIARLFDGTLRGRTIAVLGLTFKPNTDDMREAPSIPLIVALHDMGAEIKVYDPAGMASARSILPEVTYCDEPYSCAEDADALVICTEWDQFRALDLKRVRQLMREPILVDLRNIYDADEVLHLGFVYSSVGRPNASFGLRRRREIVIEQVRAAKPVNGTMLPSMEFEALNGEALSP